MSKSDGVVGASIRTDPPRVFTQDSFYLIVIDARDAILVAGCKLLFEFLSFHSTRVEEAGYLPFATMRRTEDCLSAAATKDLRTTRRSHRFRL
jgi:hypothetical protein